jgi:TFIIF-interacting CTD phosphatase-like protein
VKDLSKIGRDPKDIIIIDNSPVAYMFQHENAIPIVSWYEDSKDKELHKLMPVLERLATVDDIRHYIKYFVIDNRILFTRVQTMLKASTRGIISSDKKE